MKPETKEQVFERFERDIAEHQVKVIRDDGVYRHLRFKRPNDGNMYFDLVTWPGHLCYTGDMGDYLFERTEDMFQFFQASVHRPFPDINPGYWQEKLEAPESRSVEVYSRELYELCAKDALEQFLSDLPDGLDPKDVKNQFQEEIIDHGDEYDGALAEFEAVKRMLEFYVYRPDPERDSKTGMDRVLANLGARKTIYPFEEFYDCGSSIRHHSFHFIWCCYAIQWGIGQYDAMKEASDAGK